MIVSKIGDGLGNQMFQYAAGRSLSLKNKTGLWLDVSYFNRKPLRKFGIDAFQIHCRLTNQFELPIINRIGAALRLKKLQMHYYHDKIWEFDELLYADRHKFIHLTGYWGCPLYFQTTEDIIQKDFQLKIPLENVCKDWVKRVKEVNAVSLHIRRSDYVHNENASQFFGALNLTYYLSALKYIKEHVENPVYFVFSDDLHWVRKNFLTHLASLNYFVVEDKCLEHPAQELTLMSYCKHNIIANSTFSWWGAWLNQNKNKIVIQPFTWYKNETGQMAYAKGLLDIQGCIKL